MAAVVKGEFGILRVDNKRKLEWYGSAVAKLRDKRRRRKEPGVKTKVGLLNAVDQTGSSSSCLRVPLQEVVAACL